MTAIIAELGEDIPRKGEKLLDVGCGSGISTSVWNCDCTGIDPSEKLIEIAHKNYPGKRFVVASAEDIPFPDGAFDILISITAIHNFKDVRKAINEMKRVCKGRFVITVLRKAAKVDEIAKLAPDDAPRFRKFMDDNRVKLQKFAPCLQTPFLGWGDLLQTRLLAVLPYLKPWKSLHAELAGYSSAEEFITHALEKELALLEDADSEEDIKKRLQGLGYIS